MKQFVLAMFVLAAVVFSVTRVRAADIKTPSEIEAAVSALKAKDVAWRRIDWKTCLLDGIKASRDQHKPMILWIFIDRPIDDERC